jgi:hypothetical protein
MTRRSGMVAGLLFLVFLALALATCVTWPPMPEPVTRGPGVGLLEATAVPTIFPTYTPGPTSTPTPTATATPTPTATTPAIRLTPTNYTCRTYTSTDTPLEFYDTVLGPTYADSTITIADSGYFWDTIAPSNEYTVTASLTCTDLNHLNNLQLFTPANLMWLGSAPPATNLPTGTTIVSGTWTLNASAYITGTSPFTALWLPQTPPDLEGGSNTCRPIAGDWTLEALFNATPQSNDTCTLDAWSLTVCSVPSCGDYYAPTPTPTPTLTPWPTLTPRFTPSPTPTATLTPNWPVQNCPQLAVTLDGSLAEWAAVTPIALNVGAATEVLIAPSLRATWTPIPTATPKTGAGTATVTPRPTATIRPTSTPAPAVADFAGLLYCAHDGAGTLYLAGELTDSQIVNPVGLLSNGDAAEISLDMYADNFRQPGRDDHVITIAPNARTADFAIYPLGATAATGAAAGLWRFELALPATTHGRAGLDTGDVIGGTWGYYDNRGGTTWAYRLTAAKRRMVLQ